MSSSIGNLFRLTTFGESHGVAIGGIIDGCPSGLDLDLDSIQETASGTACIIYLTSIDVGVDVFYISSIHMIKSNGDFIDEFDILSISTKESEVIQ